MSYGTAGLAFARAVVVAILNPCGLVGLMIGLSLINVLYYVFAVVVVSSIIGVRRNDFVFPIRGPLLASLTAGVFKAINPVCLGSSFPASCHF